MPWKRATQVLQGDNFAANLALVDKINAIVADKGGTPGQLALAWVLAQVEPVNAQVTASRKISRQPVAVGCRVRGTVQVPMHLQ